MQSVWQSISRTTLNLQVIWGHTLVINHSNGTWHSRLVVILLGIDHIYVANVVRPHGGAILRWHTPGRNLINVASVVRLSQRLEVFLVCGFVIVLFFFIIISNVWVISKIKSFWVQNSYFYFPVLIANIKLCMFCLWKIESLWLYN